MGPNLFILGAGKCGTTSLHRLLGQHPDIHASRVKEPSFFCWPFQVVRNPLEYYALFDSGRRWRMEASHVYFSNPPTARALRIACPNARFLVTLRDPAARAVSLHRHMRRHGEAGAPYEPLSLAEALAAEPARLSSEAFRRACPHYLYNYLYVTSSRFDEQLARYRALYDPDRFCLTTLGELARDPAAAIDRIAGFLGIDPGPLHAAGMPRRNVAPPAGEPPVTPEVEAYLAAAFEGLTDRVDAMAGRPLDWSI